MRKRARAWALLLLVAATACSGEGGDRREASGGLPEDPATTSTPDTTGPAHEESPGRGEEPGEERPPPLETIFPVESPAQASPDPLPGRGAPDERAGALRFWQVRVYEDGGAFAWHANVTNTSTEYLNDVRFSWRILDGDRVLDSGDGGVAAIGPGETTTVTLRGAAAYRDAAFRVDVSLA
ncbi:MAG TPA: hypothetical protein VGB51_10305 [Actinomycetota bacterium]